MKRILADRSPGRGKQALVVLVMSIITVLDTLALSALPREYVFSGVI